MDRKARPKEYVLQGLPYLYLGNVNVAYFRLTFRDEIDAEKMQDALNALMEKSDYFRVRLALEGEEYFLYPNDEPCLVYTGEARRRIPEETNGYLFFVSCSGCVLTLMGTHFLSDALGWGSFLRTLAKEYCNRRYGEAFDCLPLTCAPPLSLEELTVRRGEKKEIMDSTQGILRWKKAEERILVVRLKQEDVIQNAAEMGVRPFCYLLYLCCRIVRRSLGVDTVTYSFPVDARAAVGAQDALYNCTAQFRNSVGMKEAEADILEKLQQTIDERIEKRVVLNRHWNDRSITSEINGRDFPLKMKKASYHMMTSRLVNSHLLFSYLGSNVFPKMDRCTRYLTDFAVTDLKSTFSQLFVTETTINGKMVLTFTDSSEIDGLDQAIWSEMEEHRIPIESMERGKQD